MTAEQERRISLFPFSRILAMLRRGEKSEMKELRGGKSKRKGFWIIEW
jgi:hypothetical protein